LAACWVEVLVMICGFTWPREVRFARMSVENAASSSLIRLLRFCS